MNVNMCAHEFLCQGREGQPAIVPQEGFPARLSASSHCHVARSGHSGNILLPAPHSPHQDLQTSDSPSFCLLLSVANSLQRAPRASSWAEVLLTTLGRHKAIFMQPDLPILPALPGPRIVNDHVLEETPPCHWVL